MIKWDLVMMLSIPSSRNAHIVAKSAVGDGTGDRIIEAMNKRSEASRGQQGCWRYSAVSDGMQLGKEGKLTSLFLPPYSGNVPNVGPIPKRKSELFAFHPRVLLLQSCSFGYPLLKFLP